MKRMKLPHGLIEFVGEERGATMVEYALMVLAIALLAIVGIKAVGTQLNTTYGNDIANGIATAG